MAWNTELSSDGAYVGVTYDGYVTPGELLKCFDATVALVTKHDQWHIFTDTTALQGGHSVTDLYYLADAILATGHGSKIREAVLMSALPDTAEKVRFWETTCANRGLRVRIFTDRGEALGWLRAA